MLKKITKVMEKIDRFIAGLIGMSICNRCMGQCPLGETWCPRCTTEVMTDVSTCIGMLTIKIHGNIKMENVPAIQEHIEGELDAMPPSLHDFVFAARETLSKLMNECNCVSLDIPGCDQHCPYCKPCGLPSDEISY